MTPTCGGPWSGQRAARTPSRVVVSRADGYRMPAEGVVAGPGSRAAARRTSGRRGERPPGRPGHRGGRVSARRRPPAGTRLVLLEVRMAGAELVGRLRPAAADPVRDEVDEH